MTQKNDDLLHLSIIEFFDSALFDGSTLRKHIDMKALARDAFYHLNEDDQTRQFNENLDDCRLESILETYSTRYVRCFLLDDVRDEPFKTDFGGGLLVMPLHKYMHDKDAFLSLVKQSWKAFPKASSSFDESLIEKVEDGIRVTRINKTIFVDGREDIRKLSSKVYIHCPTTLAQMQKTLGENIVTNAWKIQADEEDKGFSHSETNEMVLEFRRQDGHIRYIRMGDILPLKERRGGR